MTEFRFVTVGAVGALALALTACGEPADDNSASPYAGGGSSDAEPAAAQTTEDEAGLRPLEVAANAICEAGDDGFAALLPEGSAFASRGPDARVHAAWRYGGETHAVIIRTPDLAPEPRLAFDMAVADFMRRNMSAGFDRTGLTGAFRGRDGRFCVVQTEEDAIAPLIAAVREAESALGAGD